MYKFRPTLSLVSAGAMTLLALVIAPVSAQTINAGDAQWDFNNDQGPTINDANIPSTSQFDAFDDAGIVRVNGLTLPSQTLTQSVTGDGTFLTTAPGLLGDATVQTQFFVSNTNRVARVFSTFTNNTASAISFTATYETNLGSDSGTQIITTSSGDTTFTTADRYVVSDDGSTVGGDPANTTVLYGSGASLLPSAVFNTTTFNSAGNEGVRADFLMTLAAGETAGLVFFQQLNTTAAAATSSATTFDSNSSIASAGYFAGLSQGQLSTVRNFTSGPVLVPEVGTLPMLVLGGLGMIGAVVTRRRKQG